MAKKAKTAEVQTEQIIAYKGFDHEMKCRGFQFEVGKTYTIEGEIIACQNGFHAVDAENPFHVWDFYPIIDDEGRMSRYAEVALSGATDHEEEKRGTKIAAATIAVNVELSLPEFVRKAVERLITLTKSKEGSDESPSAQIGSSGHYAQIGSSGHSAQIGSSGHSARIGSSGPSAQIGSSGDYAQIGSSGYYAQIGSSGYSAQIGSSGDSAQIGSSGHSARIGSSGHYARIGSSGDSARIGSSGYSARIGSSGDYAQIGSSGHSAQIGSSGDYARIGSSGDYARITASGENSVIASAGVNARVKAAAGTWVSVAEFDGTGKCIGFATGCIGADSLKADTWYVAKGGKLVEA